MGLTDNFKAVLIAFMLISTLLMIFFAVSYFAGPSKPPPYSSSGYLKLPSPETAQSLAITSMRSLEASGFTPLQEAELIEASERLCWSFMSFKMATGEGVVYSTLRRGYGESSDYGVNHEVTAESIGLLMLYAVHIGDRALFDREVLFLEERLLSPLGICYWKLGEDLSPFRSHGYASSASVDDLRIVEALIQGYDLWDDGSYISLAGLMRDGIYMYEVDEARRLLVDYYVWRDGRGEKAGILTLSYAGLPALLEMSRFDGRWRIVFNETLRIVLEGSAGPHQLFQARYDLKDRRYVDGSVDA
ncbi:MAG: glycosyl hydrolase family 8, partial [Candidatus Bathyarchaeia archaeon]